MIIFLLVRHGTTDWVDQQILHGITDVPLNARGKAQANETAVVLKDSGAQKIYTSSLTRCVQTAEEIGGAISLKPILMDSLVELDFGWLEGRHFRDHDKEDFGKLAEIVDEWTHRIVRIFSGESIRIFRKRVYSGWKTIQEENPNGSVIVVAHSAVINSLLFYYFGRSYLNGEPYYHLNPCSISEIKVDDSGEAKLVRISDTSHLSEENN